MKPEPYVLDAPALMTLRCRLRSSGFVRDGSEGVMLAAPWVTYLLASHEYVLHNQGYVIAITPSDDVACYLLRNERIEPGYVRRILDPALPIDVALEPPEERRAWTVQQNANAATARAQRDADALAAQRRRTQLQPLDASGMSIEDLFS